MVVRETFDIVFIIESLPKILKALPVTLYFTGFALLFGWPLGLLAAWGKISGPKWLKSLLTVGTDIIRGIPIVVLLYIVYFGLPNLASGIFGVNISRWPKPVFIVIALVIELMTNASEMFRSAYTSIEKGQLEAAHALGYTKWQRFIHVIFPQGVYVILPNLGSAVLSMVQATALVYTLGIFDILGKARQLDVNASRTQTFEMYFICALIYWALAVGITQIFKALERVFGKGFKTMATKKDVAA
ncbi:MAG: amino acid ABC transporter permease [Treponema sp.]|nr:amino acid ABC transporter permease [Treponema sp.]